jgi:hypothetical protein
MTWSHDARTLVLASADGFCTIVTPRVVCVCVCAISVLITVCQVRFSEAEIGGTPLPLAQIDAVSVVLEWGFFVLTHKHTICQRVAARLTTASVSGVALIAELRARQVGS